MTAQLQNILSTTKLAKQLKTSNKVILENSRKCLPNKIILNGQNTHWTQEEITILLDYTKHHQGNNNLNFQSKAETELTPILRLQKLQAEMQSIYEAENEKLKLENQQQKETINDFNLTIDKKINKQELFTKINNLIRDKAGEKFHHNYAESYKFYYSEFAKRHNIYNSITMEYFKKNPIYAKELLEILLTDNKIA